MYMQHACALKEILQFNQPSLLHKFQSALGASMKLQPALYSNQSNTISVKDVQYAHYTSIINVNEKAKWNIETQSNIRKVYMI